LAVQIARATASMVIEAGETRARGLAEVRISRVYVPYMGRADVVCWSVRDGAERDWARAHAALTRLARERAAADAEEGRWLLLAWRSAAHVHLGHGSFGEYVERLLGYSPRATREKLRVAEALERLPRSAQALQQGALSWCAARELTRVATEETEAAWLEAAHGKTTRQIEALVAGKQPGEPPPAPSCEDEMPAPRRHVLRFEVSPETFATFREAMHNLRRSAGGDLGDDALLLAMARQALGAPSDDSRSSYRVSYQVCPACGRGAQLASGELVAVGADIVAMAACDGESIGVHPAPPHPPPANENRSAPKDTEAVATSPAAHVGHSRQPVPPSPAAAHVGRARQGVPPALRRTVLERDHRSCRVPGCKNSHFVDVHHLQPRSEGGKNTLENLITLCTAHHRASHRGELIIELTVQGLAFQHADGTPYGGAVTPSSVDAHAKVFGALRNLGFREREARAVLVELRNDASLRDAPTDRLLREALQRIQWRP
jgi:HNH endonuclease/Holliday junction resolvase RuvA-like protein